MGLAPSPVHPASGIAILAALGISAGWVAGLAVPPLLANPPWPIVDLFMRASSKSRAPQRFMDDLLVTDSHLKVAKLVSFRFLHGGRESPD